MPLQPGVSTQHKIPPKTLACTFFIQQTPKGRLPLLLPWHLQAHRMLPGKADLLRGSASSASTTIPFWAPTEQAVQPWHGPRGLGTPALAFCSQPAMALMSQHSRTAPKHDLGIGGRAAMPWPPDDHQDPPRALPPATPHSPSPGRGCCHARPPQASPANREQRHSCHWRGRIIYVREAIPSV